MILFSPLWETMKARGETTYTLIYKHGISSSTVNRLRHNQGVTTQLIDDLCKILNCRVEDVIVYQDDDKTDP